MIYATNFTNELQIIYKNNYINNNNNNITKNDIFDWYSIDHINEIEKLIKESIWMFRSSVNNHRILYNNYYCNNNCNNNNNENNIQKIMNEKKRLLPIWKIIGSFVSKYCNQKCQNYEKKLQN